MSPDKEELHLNTNNLEQDQALVLKPEVSLAPPEMLDGCKDSKPSEIRSSVSDPCPGVVLTYSVDANPDFTSYEWEMPRSNTGNMSSDWMIISGQGTNSIKVRAGEKAGTIKLAVEHKRCGKGVQTIPVTPKNGCSGTCSAPSGTLTGPEVVCYIYEVVEAPYVFKVENPEEGLTYDIMLPEGFIELSRGEDSVSAVSFFIPEEVDSIQTITLVTSNGCNSSISTLNVTLRDQNCEPGESSGPGGDPLPVELALFEGISRGNRVELKWTTATEINNDRFEVERSMDGKEFSVIGTVHGAGTSNTLQTYSFSDMEASEGTVYYRLNQIDFDGSHEYSKVIAVQHARAGNQGMSVKLYPNPIADGILTLKMERLPINNAPVQVQLRDMSGKVMYATTLASNTQEASLSLKDLGLRKGLYLVSLTAENESQMHRIIIQ
ncbi:T9SS type A sorting domain-containing protein [Nibribacter ruber]|uniref:T9SS type A sorting domain-containing protein n=1 Tax=Nibribacter ruber TaxID=2698458 RepID=A0A6P1P1D6_9BACT|nr:T9SS type A sorting domain-containing protein [Nibribacter ruber]QHL87062.1 T9SS type A sorting domain-containing protein [Nibribacter ruber]